MARLEDQKIWSEIKPLLAIASIQEVADRFGVTPGQIARAAVRTGTRREPVIAKPAPVASPKRGNTSALDGYRHLLGVEIDRVVARMAGVSASAALMYRRRHGIPSAPSSRARPLAATGAPSSPPGEVRPSKLDAFRELVGAFPDRLVAERAGVVTETVRLYRVRHGIPPVPPVALPTPPPASPMPAPVAPPAPEAVPATATWAYIATVRRGDTEQQYIVLGGSVAEAGSVAVRAAHDGQVISLVRHLEGLV